MPILLFFFLVEVLLYTFWISVLGFGNFVFVFLFQTFLGFFLMSSSKSLYYKTTAIFHILPSLFLRMGGLVLLFPFHLILGERLKRKFNAGFQSGVQSQPHFQFIFKNYGNQQGPIGGFYRASGRPERHGPSDQISDEWSGSQFDGTNFGELKDVTPKDPKRLQDISQ